MKTSTLPLARRLRRDQFLRLHTRQSLCVTAERGTLWLTVDGEEDDIVLAAGERRVFASGARVTVGTLGDSAAVTAVPIEKPAGQPAWRAGFDGLFGHRTATA